jgi:hypothetical protein
MPPMNRREAIRAAGLVVGGAFIASTGVLAACRTDATPGTAGRQLLTDDQQTLIEDIADTLLPTTATSPGAKAAAVGPTINLIATDCYKPEAQQAFVAALTAFRNACRSQRRRDFSELPRAERESFVTEYARATPDFARLRDLSEAAYFTSEIGATKALRWIPVPGRYEGCMQLQPGQPAWL